MLNDLVRNLTEENEKQQILLKKLNEDLAKQDEITNDLNEKKIAFQIEASTLKAKFNCIKKEIDMKKNHLKGLINKTEETPTDESKSQKIGDLAEKASEITQEINSKLGYVLLNLVSMKNYFN
jgi:predicted RNase H-like nuclease (RuvC/YqgF family)